MLLKYERVQEKRTQNLMNRCDLSLLDENERHVLVLAA